MDPFLNALAAQDGHAGEDYDPEDALSALSSQRVLLVGAGGIGCEVLKNLVLAGVHKIDVIDLDHVDLSNLNRQFLFREEDVGLPKASAAVKSMIQVVKTRPDFAKFELRDFVQPVQSLPLDQMNEYFMIITALDNVEARRYCNDVVFQLAQFEGEPDENGVSAVKEGTQIIMVDGASEGTTGLARVIIPGMPIACYECTLYLQSGGAGNIPLCTLAHTPRNAEHCIEWARLVAWKERGDEAFDADDSDHVEWIHEKALCRARENNIPAFTLFYTFGVLKRIIPAVASTNAIASAYMSNLALRFLLDHTTNFDATIGSRWNYINILGDSAYFEPLDVFRMPGCPTCSEEARQSVSELTIDPDMILEDFLAFLKESAMQCNKPSLSLMSVSDEAKCTTIWSQSPILRASLEENLTKPMRHWELVGSTDLQLSISDPAFVQPRLVKLVAK